MFFQAYPIIFQGIYGFNAGEEGLAFLPIGFGSLVACAVYLWWDKLLADAKARSPPPKWTQSEEYRRLPLACLGGPLFVISLFWLGWTARSDVHWAVPLMAAFPFGIGFLLLFMALSMYTARLYFETLLTILSSQLHRRCVRSLCCFRDGRIDLLAMHLRRCAAVCRQAYV